MSLLIYAESQDGKFKKVAFELASYAKKVAESLGTTVTAVTVNAGNVSELSKYGVDKVLKVSNDKLANFNAKAYADVVKQAAQDHAMSHSAILKGLQRKTFETAMCIQQTQGGYISPDKYKLLVLPYSLREKALSVRNLKNYSKLWDDINNFNVKLGANSGGMLVNFLKKFEKELDHFVAEFEIVPKQVGAIILIDGEVVGIEKAPSYEYWASIWNALIRECYGSRALEVTKSYQGRELPAFKSSLEAENINTLQDLEDAIKKAKQEQEAIAHKKVRELVDNTFAVEAEEKLEGFEVNTIENIQFIGQVIRDHDKVCYISLVTSQNWVKNQAWYKAPAFSI